MELVSGDVGGEETLALFFEPFGTVIPSSFIVKRAKYVVQWACREGHREHRADPSDLVRGSPQTRPDSWRKFVMGND